MARYTVHQKDTTQDALVAWLEARGCQYQHIGQPVDGLLSVPIRKQVGELGSGYLTIPVEWKSRRGHLRPVQVSFIERWLAPVYVLKTEVQCAAMLAELGAVRT